jgi:hypothetical protein
MTGVELFLLINTGMLGAILYKIYTLDIVLIGIVDEKDLK